MIAESGTSMSTPVVTGIIALWLQADPTLTPAKIKEVLAATDGTIQLPVLSSGVYAVKVGHQGSTLIRL